LSYLIRFPFTIKKYYRSRFTRLVKSPITTKQVCAFRRFQFDFSVNLNDIKNEPKWHRNRSKLSAWILVFDRVIVS